jgi:hypothetical protein
MGADVLSGTLYRHCALTTGKAAQCFVRADPASLKPTQLFLYFRPELKLNSVALAYADRATAACWRSNANFLRIDGIAWSAQRIPTVVNLRFLDRSRYFSFK